VADSCGRFGSGGAYAAGHAGDGAELLEDVEVGLGAVVAGAAEADGDDEGDAAVAAGAPDLADPVLQPASSAARTTQEVRTCRR
jgi:hypothetical protein